MKTVLITGVAGFIGSNLCRRLLNDGYKVIGVDNFSTGSIDNLSFIKDDNFVLLEGDICEMELDFKVDYVLHFASPASPPEYKRLAIETVNVNSIGALNTLELAKRNNARIIVASTSEIYGDPLEHPQKETYYGNTNTVGERSVYDESKRFMETLAITYYNTFGVNTGIVRLFNSYGRNMKIDDGRAIPNFFSQAIKNEDITISGDGTYTRSFCYVDDTVDGIIKLMLSDYHYPINIGNEYECTLNNLADEIILITGSKSKKIFIPLTQDDPKKRKPDISLAMEVLGWFPKTSRFEGLNKSYQYFKEKINK